MIESILKSLEITRTILSKPWIGTKNIYLMILLVTWNQKELGLGIKSKATCMKCSKREFSKDIEAFQLLASKYDCQ